MLSSMRRGSFHFGSKQLRESAQRDPDIEGGKMKLSRRNFLGMAAGAGVLGALSITGCAPQSAPETSDATNGGKTLSETGSATRPDYYMCDEDWLGSAPEIAADEITSTNSFDVVVVGGGHAGTQAALAAAQEGAKVAVIEKHNDGEIIYRGDDIL